MAGVTSSGSVFSRTFGSDRAVRRWAIVSLVANIAIVLTGATVRLTGSGLGCPTWPQCTDESYLPHGALGIHGAIEFGNRLMTFVLSAVAILTAVAAFSLRDAARPKGDLRRLGVLLAIGVPVMAVGLVIMIASGHHPVAVLGLTGVFAALLVVSIIITRSPLTHDPVSRRHEHARRLALVLALGIPAQAVFGGITVMTQLNPWIVAGHLLVSFALIAASMWLVHTIDPAPRPAVGATGWLLARLVAGGLVVVLWLGTVVTGSGPHSGDENARRTGLDPELMSHIHAAAVYVTIGLTVAAVLVLRSRAAVLMLVLEIAQGAVGLVQYWTGLPIVVVMVHMLGSALLVAVGAHLVWTTDRERALEESTPTYPSTHGSQQPARPL